MVSKRTLTGAGFGIATGAAIVTMQGGLAHAETDEVQPNPDSPPSEPTTAEIPMDIVIIPLPEDAPETPTGFESPTELLLNDVSVDPVAVDEPTQSQESTSPNIVIIPLDNAEPQSNGQNSAPSNEIKGSPVVRDDELEGAFQFRAVTVSTEDTTANNAEGIMMPQTDAAVDGDSRDVVEQQESSPRVPPVNKDSFLFGQPQNSAFVQEQTGRVEVERPLIKDDVNADDTENRFAFSQTFPGATTIEEPTLSDASPQNAEVSISVPEGTTLQLQGLTITGGSGATPTVTNGDAISPIQPPETPSPVVPAPEVPTPVPPAEQPPAPVAPETYHSQEIYNQAYNLLNNAIRANGGVLTQEDSRQILALLTQSTDHPPFNDPEFTHPEKLILMPAPSAAMPYRVHPNTCKTELFANHETIMAGMYQVALFEWMLERDEYAQYRDFVVQFGDFLSGDHRTHHHGNKLDIRSIGLTSEAQFAYASQDGPLFNVHSPNYDEAFMTEFAILKARSIGDDGKVLFEHSETTDWAVINAVNEAVGRRALIHVKGHDTHHHDDTGHSGEEFSGGMGTPNTTKACEFVYINLSNEMVQSIRDRRNGQVAAQSAVYAEPQAFGVLDTNAQGFTNSMDLIDPASAVQGLRAVPAVSQVGQEPIQVDPRTQFFRPMNELQLVIQDLPPAGVLPVTPDVQPTPSTGEVVVTPPAVIENEYDRHAARLAEMVQVGAVTEEYARQELASITPTARVLLESLPVYDVVDPHVAYQLRVDNPRFTPYLQEAKNYGRRLTPEEIMIYLEATHRMVYGDSFDAAKRKEMVQYMGAAQLYRESLGYPHMVKTFESGGVENNASSGLSQIKVDGAVVNPNEFTPIHDLDENLDPVRSNISTWQFSKIYYDKGEHWATPWLAGWKPADEQRADLRKIEAGLRELTATEVYTRALGRLGLLV